MVEPGAAHVPLELFIAVDLSGARGTDAGPDDRELDSVLRDFVPANDSVVGGHVDAVGVAGVVDPQEGDRNDEDDQSDDQELQSAFDECLILFPKRFDPLLKRAAPAPFSAHYLMFSG
jgi:hypothetical protein